MMGEVPLTGAELAHIQATADISRIGAAPLAGWAQFGLTVLGAVGFVLTAYVLIKAWRDRSK